MVNAKTRHPQRRRSANALGPVLAVAHAARASLVGLVHVNKTSEGDLLNRIMASKALTAVPRGFLFCAKPQTHRDTGRQTDEDHLFAGRDGTQEFLLGQIKNNLAAKVMISHRYHMETEVVGYDEEAQKDIKASKIIIHGLIAQNVEDIVLEQEKAKKRVRTEGGKAEAWLVGYLQGRGEVASAQIEQDGKSGRLIRGRDQTCTAKLGDDRVVDPQLRRSHEPPTGSSSRGVTHDSINCDDCNDSEDSVVLLSQL